MRIRSWVWGSRLDLKRTHGEPSTGATQILCQDLRKRGFVHITGGNLNLKFRVATKRTFWPQVFCCGQPFHVLAAGLAQALCLRIVLDSISFILKVVEGVATPQAHVCRDGV